MSSHPQQPPAPTPSPLPTQELRIAASFSGGVSLAIWMGGLTYELDRLLRSSDAERADRLGDPVTLDPPDPRYAALLRLLHVDVDVDVLTGTSAGGINGAALAMARAHGSTLEPLRQVWLQQGSFTRLLRSLEDPRPPSLLQGDGVLLAGLREGLTAIRDASARTPGEGRRTATGKGEPSPSRENRMRLLITATMTAPDVATVRDSLGTAVAMEDNQAIFTFDQPPGYQPDPGEFEVDPLARAARSSASYPAAFEPSFVRVGEGPGGEPDLAGHLGVHSSRWMVDGGLRNNQPVGTALRAVWEQPAGERVRRVLLHVVPDPKRKPEKPAQPGDPPGLLSALGITVAAPFVQSWRADLDEIRRQSRGARRRAAGLAPLHRVVGDDPQAWPVLVAALRDVRGGWVADDFVTGLDGQLGRFATVGKGPAAGWTDYSSGLFERARTRCREAAAAHWSDAPALDLQAADPDLAEVLAHYGPDLFNAALGVALAGLRSREATGVPAPNNLTWAQAAADLHACRVAGGAPVRFERDLVVAFLQRELAAAGPVREADAVDWSAGLFDRWLDAAFPCPDVVRQAGDVDEVADTEARLRASWQELLAWLRTTGLPGQVLGDAESDEPLARRVLLARAAVDLLTLGDGRLADQSIDLVQVSGFTRCTWAPTRATPDDKLMGVGLAHFGAFVRRSWRANDWMWGRLDGAGWLVHLLLAPARLRAVAQTLPGPDLPTQVAALLDLVGDLACRARDGSEDADLRRWWDDRRSELAAEAAALAAPTLTVQALPLLSMAVARGIQRDIAAEELPIVASAMEQTEAGDGVTARAADAAFVRLVRENLTLDGTRLRAAAVGTALDIYSVQDDTGAASLLRDAELRGTLLGAVAVGTAAVDSSTPGSVPLLPQAVGTLRRGSAGLARSVQRQSVSGWAAAALAAVGVVLLVIGGMTLTAVGLPLVVGGVVALVLLGLGAPQWVERLRPVVLAVGILASLVAAWWVTTRVTDAGAAELAQTYARPLAFVGVALLGVLVTALLWLVLRWLARLGAAPRR